MKTIITMLAMILTCTYVSNSEALEYRKSYTDYMNGKPEVSIDVGLKIYHWKRNYVSKMDSNGKVLETSNYNELNAGLGIKVKTDDYSIHLGQYKNSFYEDSVYLTMTRKVSSIEMGFTAATGYAHRGVNNVGNLLIMPMASKQFDLGEHFQLDLLVNPAFVGARFAYKL